MHVPDPGEVCTCRFQPASAARSCMLINPILLHLLASWRLKTLALVLDLHQARFYQVQVDLCLVCVGMLQDVVQRFMSDAQ